MAPKVIICIALHKKIGHNCNAIYKDYLVFLEFVLELIIEYIRTDGLDIAKRVFYEIKKSAIVYIFLQQDRELCQSCNKLVSQSIERSFTKDGESYIKLKIQKYIF